jgi:hypothetical protein
MSKETLKNYSAIIATLRTHDIIVDRIWKYGIPWPDGVIVRGRMGVDDLPKLKELFRIPELNGIEVFPLGIPYPDVLDVRFKIGDQIVDG